MLEALLQFLLKHCPEPLKKIWDKNERALRYCYYGAWTTLVSIVTKLVGGWLFALGGMNVGTDKLPNTINTAISWVISVAFAFVVNKKYVFFSKTEEKGDLLREITTFFGARGFTFVLEWILLLLPTFFGWNYYLMVFLAQVIIFILNYVFSKLLVFTRGKKAAPDAGSESKTT